MCISAFLFPCQNPRETRSRSRIFLFSLVIYVCWLLVCTGPPCQTENDTDLKFGTHAPIDLTEKQVFVEKMTPEAASLEKLPCHVDFPHISLIALSVYELCLRKKPDKSISSLIFPMFSIS